GDERDHPRRPGQPGEADAAGLRGLPHGATDPVRDGVAAGHEPLDVPARLHHRRQEGRHRPQLPDPRPVPPRCPVRRAVLLLRAEIKAEDLPHLTWNEWGYGTNMQHAFMLSRQLLARHKGGTRQIILITDGEPTAYFEGGQIEFSYPPTYRTFQETLREVGRCTRENIVINTFMLERGHYLIDFVEQMTKINR